MFKLHLTVPSIIVGASLVLIAGATVPLVAPTEVEIVGSVHVMTHPLSEAKDFVRIEEGTPYVVPFGRILILRSVGMAVGNSGQAQIKINGAIVFDQVVSTINRGGEYHMTPGWPVTAGAIVVIVEPAGSGDLVLLAYLAEI